MTFKANIVGCFSWPSAQYIKALVSEYVKVVIESSISGSGSAYSVETARLIIAQS